jgi:hypothetical protein
MTMIDLGEEAVFPGDISRKMPQALAAQRKTAWHGVCSPSDETHVAQGYLKAAVTTGLSVLLLATSVGTANVVAADGPRDEGLSGEQLFFKRCTECHAGESIFSCLGLALSICPCPQDEVSLI